MLLLAVLLIFYQTGSLISCTPWLLTAPIDSINDCEISEDVDDEDDEEEDEEDDDDDEEDAEPVFGVFG
jgi:hypothetical protein